MVDYSLYSEATAPYFAKYVEQCAQSFRAWRAKRPSRSVIPVRELFPAWWMGYGPLDFKSGQDAVRFRREVLALLEADEARETA